MLPHGEGFDDLVCDGHEAVVIGALAHFLPELVAALEEGDQIMPVVLHAVDGVALALENDAVGVAELVQECFQGLPVGAAAEHAGVRHQTAADHDGIDGGELGGDFLRIGDGIDVAVVADGEGGVFHSLCKSCHVAVALVEGLADPGVDGQLLHGVIPVDFQNFLPIFRVIDTDAGLQGHGQGGLGVDGFQEFVQGKEVGQHAAALALADHGAGGTAHIQVHFAVSHG